jgi:hypothetical protein
VIKGDFREDTGKERGYKYGVYGRRGVDWKIIVITIVITIVIKTKRNPYTY